MDLLASATIQVNLDFHLLSINERKTRAGNSIIELRLNAVNTPVQETSCQLYHSPLLHAFLRPMICMHPFLFCFYDFLIFLCRCLVFHTHLFYLFVPCLWLDALPVCVVTSCPVLEFELRKAKETIQALRANLTQAAGVAHF